MTSFALKCQGRNSKVSRINELSYVVVCELSCLDVVPGGGTHEKDRATTGGIEDAF
jgi:hypothetical protein